MNTAMRENNCKHVLAGIVISCTKANYSIDSQITGINPMELTFERKRKILQ